MNEMATDDVETEAWLLKGLTGNVPGILGLVDGRLIFVTDDEQIVFDAPLSEVSNIKFPWYYFGGGMKLSVGAERYRLSFVLPTAVGGGVADIPEGRSTCKMWRSLLEPSSSGKG